MVGRKSQKSSLRATLITIVKLGLSVKSILSTRGSSIRNRLKKPERKAELIADDRKRKSSLDKFKLKFEPLASELDIKRKIRRVKREKGSKNTK
jgi:hypothetical protein